MRHGGMPYRVVIHEFCAAAFLETFGQLTGQFLIGERSRSGVSETIGRPFHEYPQLGVVRTLDDVKVSAIQIQQDSLGVGVSAQRCATCDWGRGEISDNETAYASAKEESTSSHDALIDESLE